MKPVNTGLHCPACGVKDVWQDEDDAGDFYAGTAMHCLACNVVLSDIQVSAPYPDDSPGLAFLKRERDAFVRCCRTGVQPPPPPPREPGPMDAILAAHYSSKIAIDQWSDALGHPVLSGIPGEEPK